MKQPLMIIPPAQAEALYDFALEDEQHDRFKRTLITLRSEDDWDDGAATDMRHARSKAAKANTVVPRLKR